MCFTEMAETKRERERERAAAIARLCNSSQGTAWEVGMEIQVTGQMNFVG